jgi:hypothetical protein
MSGAAGATLLVSVLRLPNCPASKAPGFFLKGQNVGIPAVIVSSGGLPIVEATNGLGVPMTEATNGFGIPVTFADFGLPVVGITSSSTPTGDGTMDFSNPDNSGLIILLEDI